VLDARRAQGLDGAVDRVALGDGVEGHPRPRGQGDPRAIDPDPTRVDPRE